MLRSKYVRPGGGSSHADASAAPATRTIAQRFSMVKSYPIPRREKIKAALCGRGLGYTIFEVIYLAKLRERGLRHTANETALVIHRGGQRRPRRRRADLAERPCRVAADERVRVAGR